MVPDREESRQNQPEAGKPSPREQFSQALGSVLLFLGGHPLYEMQLLADVRNRVLPPVKLGQYRTISRTTGDIAAYVSWAKLNAEAERRLAEAVADGDSWNLPLSADEWNSGSETVIIDAVTAEPGMEEKACGKIKRELFPRESLRALLPDPETGVPRLKTIVR